MSIEDRITKYNVWVQRFGLLDWRHCKKALRKAAWVKRCADRQGIRIKATGSLGYKHAGNTYPLPLYEMVRRTVLLDEAQG